MSWTFRAGHRGQAGMRGCAQPDEQRVRRNDGDNVAKRYGQKEIAVSP
jgi:hypothetical protein